MNNKIELRERERNLGKTYLEGVQIIQEFDSEYVKSQIPIKHPSRKIKWAGGYTSVEFSELVGAGNKIKLAINLEMLFKVMELNEIIYRFIILDKRFKIWAQRY